MTNVREVLAQLKGVKRQGKEWQALCPAHEDRKASLSISEGGGGKALTHCHAGCTPEQVWSALHLNGTGRREIATYDYRDENEKLLYQSVRFEPKDFRQRRPDGQGGWIWNLNGGPRVLYRLPELLTSDDSRTVLIVEGEKDCDRLAQIGLVATTNAGGALKWHDEYNEALRGRKVAIFPDKDEPGRKHAQQVATSLHGIAENIKIVELPGLPEKGDISDWLDAGGTIRELRDIVNATAVYVPAMAGHVATEIDPDDAAIARLAKLSPLAYERVRESEAQEIGCRTSILDKLVAAMRPKGGNNDLQGRALMLREIEPWPEAVNGATVLSEVSEQLSHYIALPPGAADVIAAWIAHTYVYDAFEHTPRLNITSPDKQCGKTTTRDVIGEMVCRPLSTENLSTAVLFRVIEKTQSTILADEVDTWLGNNDELQGLMNAGHKRGGQVWRCEGESNEIRAFNVFAPAVLCGIGSISGTLADRSIKIQLARAKRGEIQQRFDSRHTAHLTLLARKLARFCADSRVALERCDPVLPESAFNRIADNWRPFFAIANVAGGDWPERIARAFASLVTKTDLDDQGINTMLLADIREVFAGNRMFSRVLVSSLTALADRPWPEANRGKPITERWLASHLRGFKIYPGDVHVGGTHAKGYELTAFAESFARYLDDTQEDPDPGDSNRATVQTRINISENKKSNRAGENEAHDQKMQERPINIDVARLHDQITPDRLIEHYREPTKEEIRRAAQDPEEWRRLEDAAERGDPIGPGVI